MTGQAGTGENQAIDTARNAPGRAPPDAPLIGLSGRALALGYVVIVALGLALAVAAGIPPDHSWGEAATALGIIALAMMALQFLSSGRFRGLTGRIGIDRSIAFHRWAARILLIAVVLHPLLYTVPTFMADPARGFDRLGMMFLGERARTGLIAWLAVIAIVLLAVLRDRLRMPYEAWRGLHALLGAVALGFGTAHALAVGTYAGAVPMQIYWYALAGAALASLVVVHVWRGLSFRRDPWRLVSTVQKARGLWELTFHRINGRPFPYRAGQFVWLATAPRRHTLFDHPFSIASSPRERDLRLIIKEAGDYTGRIGALPRDTLAGIDGPHGAFTATDKDADAILLLAGGVGIAPIMGLLRDFAHAGETRPIRVIVAAGTADRLVGRAEIEAMRDKLDLNAWFVLDSPPDDWDGETGIVDEALLKRALEGLPLARTLSMACGPTAFMTSTADTLIDLGLDRDNVHYERFDYDEGALSRLDIAQRWRFRALGAALLVGTLAFALRG
ncbi:MAG: ferric reductase-like transmembrane domain-containing protein [Salinarimonas sp.]|nr:ferric reductase-like transmembrane domain-containing protein [Salinarimonas sp.]